jgi:hypothetical protein
MDDQNKPSVNFSEEPNSNFDDELDNYDAVTETGHSKDEVELKPKKQVKPRSQKQIDAFKKARETRQRNLEQKRIAREETAAKKAPKPKPIEQVETQESSSEEEIIVNRPQRTKKKAKKKRIVYQEPTSSDSSDEEVIAVVKRRKAPKKKVVKKPPPKVIYEDDLDSSSDDGGASHGGHYIDVPRQPQLYIA